MSHDKKTYMSKFILFTLRCLSQFSPAIVVFLNPERFSGRNCNGLDKVAQFPRGGGSQAGVTAHNRPLSGS